MLSTLLRTLGAVPLALAVMLTLVWLMQSLISADTAAEPPAPSVVYLIEAAAIDTEPPEPEPQPPDAPEAPKPPDPEPLPETPERSLDARPLDLPTVAKPPEPKPAEPKPKPQPKPQQPVSQPKVARQSTATAKPAAQKPAAPATFDPRLISAPRPKYPANARRRRIEGSVTVKFTVTREGRVSNPHVIAAHPPGVFEREALHTIRRWRFRPQTADFPGVVQKIRFDLRGSDR
jgi:protein TonB